MNITITGKDLKATDAIKDYVEKKLGRIEKYFGDEDTDVNVTIKVEKTSQIADMCVKVKGVAYRAVTENKDLYASIDKDIDILEAQIRKEKTRREKITKDSSIKQQEMEMSKDTRTAEIEDEVIKTTYYDVRPMSIEDAILKIKEKSTNQFVTFINLDTNKVNVLYRLKDGKNYGIVEPEC